MAYAPYNSTSPNVPRLASQTIAGVKTYEYFSTHTQVTVGTSDFWSDGFYLGARVGDRLVAIESTTGRRSEHTVNSVGSTFTGLSAGLCVSSAS